MANEDKHEDEDSVVIFTEKDREELEKIIEKLQQEGYDVDNMSEKNFRSY